MPSQPRNRSSTALVLFWFQRLRDLFHNMSPFILSALLVVFHVLPFTSFYKCININWSFQCSFWEFSTFCPHVFMFLLRSFSRVSMWRRFWTIDSVSKVSDPVDGNAAAGSWDDMEGLASGNAPFSIGNRSARWAPQLVMFGEVCNAQQLNYTVYNISIYIYTYIIFFLKLHIYIV